MSLIPWNPFHNLEKFWDDDFVPFFPALRLKMPAVDVSETENEVVIEMEAPGVDPKNIELAVEGNHLHIKTSAEEKKEEKGKAYYRKEIRKGAFERAVALPTQVKGDKAEATYKDGVLKIVIPKAEVARPKKIEVKVK